MNVLETQVGQIFISDKRLSRSFVSLLSEKVPETNAELFSLVEIPLLNPTAWAEYEKLAKNIQSGLRKNFRRPNDNAFENSIAQINDELAKLAASGQTAWVGKINAVLAVRQNDNLFVSTTGKIHAYLFRDKQLSELADSPTKINPLKTFENFAVGKVLRKDFLIFTTSQLFNYISVERLKDILNDAPLGTACQKIAEIIKNLADETISFGTFILELGAAKEFSADGPITFSNPLPTGIKSMAGSLIPVTPILLPLRRFIIRAWNRIKIFRPHKLNLKDVSPTLIAQRAREMADMEKIKALPRAKKFFLISAAVFVLILIVNIFVAIHLHSSRKEAEHYKATFEQIDQQVADANSAYIYNDKSKAVQLLMDAQKELAALPDVKSIKAQKDKVKAELNDLLGSIGGLRTVDVQEVASYSGSANKLKIASGQIYLINTDGNLYVPLKNNSLKDSFTLSGSAANINSNDNILIYVDNDGRMHSIDPQSQSATTQKGTTKLGKGLVFYGSPTKAYTVDTSSNQILVSVVSSDNAPSNYLKQSEDLSKAIDLAIDGSVYVLYPDQVKKFVSGQEKTFANPGLNYADNARIFAGLNWKYVYIMDPASKKIVVLDRSGNIKSQYTSDKFSDLKDMIVDEANKTIYLLNGSSILKFQLSM